MLIWFVNYKYKSWHSNGIPEQNKQAGAELCQAQQMLELELYI